MAQTDTFDPKRYIPYQSGLRSADVLSTFPSIDTAADGVKLAAGSGEHRKSDGPRHGGAQCRPT